MSRLVKIVIGVVIIIAALGISIMSGALKQILYKEAAEVSLEMLPAEAFASEEERASLEALSESNQVKVADFLIETGAGTAKGLPATADTTLSEGAPTKNNGAKEVIEVAAADGSRKNIIIRFADVGTALAENPDAESITLHLFISGIPSEITMAVHPFLADEPGWDELALTWKSNGDEPWPQPGGPVEPPLLAAVRVTEADAESWLELALPLSNLRSVLGSDFDDISLIVTADSASAGGAVKFKSRDSQTDNKPYLNFN